MLNRILSLTVAVVAPASAAAMLYVGAHPAAVVTFAERVPCLGLAILAVGLGALHARFAQVRASAFEAAMWWGLAVFLVVAAFASPHLGAWAIVGVLTLAGTSVARLANRSRRIDATSSPFRRRIFA